MSAAYGLTIAGGIITLVMSIISAVVGSLVSALIPLGGLFVGGLLIAVAIWGIIVGIVLIISAIMMKDSKKARTGSILGLIFSILGLVTGQGFFIGPILGLVGSIIAIKKK